MTYHSQEPVNPTLYKAKLKQISDIAPGKPGFDPLALIPFWLLVKVKAGDEWQHIELSPPNWYETDKADFDICEFIAFSMILELQSHKLRIIKGTTQIGHKYQDIWDSFNLWYDPYEE